ncbi:MAG: bifunctional tRNA (5-methylaminomethyl-2-thiouridine)(34)-methyltransferase MnmD/FAD-dependent 5-carboxymethylaminomethyl-2-thiouridine(34) oxidoreductase MnmC [Pseudomonadota bacterium]
MAGEIETAKVDWAADAPRSIFFGDIYFSGDGAGEARHVFVDGNDLQSRFASAQRFSIGELGFGTGLNILVASDLWRRTAKLAGARLHFLSFEKHPLLRDDLARALSAFPQFEALGEPLLAQYPPPVEGVHRLRLADDVSLTLVLGDARRMLAATEASINAWFLDGFAPSRNPDMWTPEVFDEIARLSSAGATAATFSVAGIVRRALEGAGFEVGKRPGYGRKREMLTARIAEPAAKSNRAPWFANESLKPLPSGASVAIIGGGVAGASLARELAFAGLQPTIFERDAIASGASGNPAGLIMPRLDLGGGSSSQFFRIAYLHVLRTIASIEGASGERIYKPCGVLLKAATDEERARQERIVAAKLFPSGWIEARDDGLFFPQAGVIDPPRYCALLAAGARIVRERTISLEALAEGVIVRSEDGAHERFDAAVIANGRDALRFVEARSLPLSGVAGQIDFFPGAAPPPHAVAFGPYAAPAPTGGIVIGATYEKIDAGEEPRTSAAASAENIASVGAVLADLAQGLAPSVSQPRASIRCQTPDRLPVAGPLPDWSYFGGVYDNLRLGKKSDYPPGRVTPGVFILAGLGSRGMVTAPYAAAMMAAEMTGAPIEREIAEALHPARFFIRDLKRSQRIVAR